MGTNLTDMRKIHRGQNTRGLKASWNQPAPFFKAAGTHPYSILIMLCPLNGFRGGGKSFLSSQQPFRPDLISPGFRSQRHHGMNGITRTTKG